MPVIRRRVVALAALLALPALASARGVGAQVPMAGCTPRPEPVPLYLAAQAAANASPAELSAVDLYADAVAGELQERLAGDGRQVIDPWLPLRAGAGPHVEVRAGRDGVVRVTATHAGTTMPGLVARAPNPSGVGELTQALRDAVDAVGARGERLLFTDQITADTLAFVLGWLAPAPGAATSPGRPAVEARFAVRVATVPVYAVRPPRPLEPMNLRYPDMNNGRLATGVVRVAYLVGADGRVDPASIREEWPAGVVRPTGDAGVYYQRFLRAVRDAIAESRYEPATIGGCARPQPTHFDAGFGVRRR